MPIPSPLTTESAMKKTEDNNTLLFLVDVKTNKCQTKQAMKKLYDTDPGWGQGQHSEQP